MTAIKLEWVEVTQPDQDIYYRDLLRTKVPALIQGDPIFTIDEQKLEQYFSMHVANAFDGLPLPDHITYPHSQSRSLSSHPNTVFVECAVGSLLTIAYFEASVDVGIKQYGKKPHTLGDETILVTPYGLNPEEDLDRVYVTLGSALYARDHIVHEGTATPSIHNKYTRQYDLK